MRVLDPYNLEILEYLNINLTQSSILKIINNKLEKEISITSLRYHIENTAELQKARDNYSKGTLLK